MIWAFRSQLGYNEIQLVTIQLKIENVCRVIIIEFDELGFNQRLLKERKKVDDKKQDGGLRAIWMVIE